MALSTLADRYEAALAAVATILDAKFIDLYHHGACERLQYSPAPARSIVAAGPYAFDRLLFSGQDVRMVCISANSRGIFWPFFHESFQLSDQVNMTKAKVDGVVELSSLDLSLNSSERGVSLRELAHLSRIDQLGIRTYLHFCQLPKEYAIWDLAAGQIEPSPSDEYDSRGLSLAVKAQQLTSAEEVKTSAQKALFRKVYTDIYLWCTFHGLIGPRFGFLNSAMLVEITMKALPTSLPVEFDENDERIEAFDRFKRLMQRCCNCQASDIVPTAAEIYISSIKQLFRRELTPEARAANLAAIVQDDTTTHDASTPDVRPKADRNALRMPYEDYLLVECESWAPSLNDRTKFQEVDAARNLNNVIEAFRHDARTAEETNHFAIDMLRIWPKSIYRCPEQKEQSLVVGINKQSGAKEQFKQNIHNLPSYIEEHILDYDRTIGLITFKHLHRNELETYQAQVSLRNNHFPSSTPPQSTPTSNKNPRFRPSSSAISRLLHDAAHGDENYLIGYQDRFSETLTWIPLKLWVGKHVEDLDFIPQHRVRQIKLVDVAEEVVIWDRERRVDRI